VDRPLLDDIYDLRHEIFLDPAVGGNVPIPLREGDDLKAVSVQLERIFLAPGILECHLTDLRSANSVDSRNNFGIFKLIGARGRHVSQGNVLYR
jgi:hypothetical protein